MLISEFSLEPDKILKIINEHISSEERQKQIDDYRYFLGDNVFISTVRKLYFSDAAKGFVENPYKSNTKIGYDFFGTLVESKNMVLLDEPPIIVPKNEGQDITFLTEALGDNWGNVLKEFSEQAGAKGKGYVFRETPEQGKTNLIVFDTENTIEFVDEYTGEIQGFYRYWKVGKDELLIVEVYSLEGLTVFKQTKNGQNTLTISKPLTPYRQRGIAYGGVIDTNSVAAIPTAKFPIVKLPNNKQEKSDLTPNVKGKIDAIDVVQSDFANNLTDFNDIFWIIKNPAATSDEIQDWAAQIAKKKAVITEAEGGADAKTVEIPHAARTKFAEDMKADLNAGGGIIPSSLAANVTATAIRFAAQRLKSRVSKFEYLLYKATREIIDLVLEALGVQLEYTLQFNKNYPDNATELLTNMALVSTNMAQIDRLRVIKRAGLIDSVEATLEALQAEQQARYTVDEVDDEETDTEPPQNNL